MTIITHKVRIITLYCGLVSGLLALCGCTPVLTGDLAATYTVQAKHASDLATKIAQGLQGTTEVRTTQSYATRAVFDAIATSEFMTNDATQKSFNVYATQTEEIFHNQLATALTWPVVLTDTFVDDSNGWPSGEAADEYGASRWSFIDNKFQWSADAKQGFIWWAVPNQPQTNDFYMRVLVQQIQGPLDAAFGFIFRLSEDQNYYALEITQAGQFGLFQHDAGGWTTLLPWVSLSAIKPDMPNELAILAQNDKFYFLINGEQFASYSNPTLNNGQNGLLVSLFHANDQAMWVFSDFELRAPQGSQIELTPTTTLTVTLSPEITPTP